MKKKIRMLLYYQNAKKSKHLIRLVTTKQFINIKIMMS